MAKSKRELDKDLMFQKILPAIADNPFSTVYQTNHIGDTATEEEKNTDSNIQNILNLQRYLLMFCCHLQELIKQMSLFGAYYRCLVNGQGYSFTL